MALKLKKHPMAGDFPEISGDEFEELKASIKEKGIIDPILLYGPEEILDGWNRYRAATEVGAKIVGKDLKKEGKTEQEAMDMAIAKNVRRRHMNETQRAWTASSYVTAKLGDNQHDSEDEEGSANVQNLRTAADMSSAFIISERSIQTAKKVRNAIEDGNLLKDFQEHISSGRIAVSAAEQCIGQNKGFQKDVVKNPKDLKALLNQKRRNERDEVIKDTSDNLPEDEFQIVFIDPVGQNLSVNDIVENKPKLGEKGLVFLWTTAKDLMRAGSLLEDAWDLKYTDVIVWVKPKAGSGKWARDNREFLLIATTQDGFDLPKSELLLGAGNYPQGDGGEKPSDIIEWIEAEYPTAKKLEMYGKSPRDGWTAWGFEQTGVTVENAKSEEPVTEPTEAEIEEVVEQKEMALKEEADAEVLEEVQQEEAEIKGHLESMVGDADPISQDELEEMTARELAEDVEIPKFLQRDGDTSGDEPPL